MQQTETFNTVLNLMPILFIWLLGLIFATILVTFIYDISQSKNALLKNYPVVGHFRYLFSNLGSFFRQYFFAMDREEMPFNRAEREWVDRASKGRDNTNEHTHVAEMTIAKARRKVEEGKDVVIILDGITRLSRAYNLAAPSSGKILSGGIDAGALYPPKKFFGSARNVEEGGSLTILATALVDTNSRMDEAIFEEFKGTGNMELRLDRKVAERRIYPAIDVDASSTRHEELLFDRKQLQMVWKLRRVLSGLAADGNAAPGLELLIDRLKTFRTNAEFLSEIAKQPGM